MVRRPLRSDLSRSIADLAIELGDPGRMMRARKLHRAGNVGDIAVETLRLHSPVFGTGNDTYETSILADGSGSLAGSIPDFGRIRAECTCPDWGDVCKHALALLLTFAEEVEDQPHLASVWLDEGESMVDGVESATISHPFLSAVAVERNRSVPTVDDLVVNPATSLSFDGTDAWPIFSDAIETIRREARR